MNSTRKIRPFVEETKFDGHGRRSNDWSSEDRWTNDRTSLPRLRREGRDTRRHRNEAKQSNSRFLRKISYSFVFLTDDFRCATMDQTDETRRRVHSCSERLSRSIQSEDLQGSHSTTTTRRVVRSRTKSHTNLDSIDSLSLAHLTRTSERHRPRFDCRATYRRLYDDSDRLHSSKAFPSE